MYIVSLTLFESHLFLSNIMLLYYVSYRYYLVVVSTINLPTSCLTIYYCNQNIYS